MRLEVEQVKVCRVGVGRPSEVGIRFLRQHVEQLRDGIGQFLHGAGAVHVVLEVILRTHPDAGAALGVELGETAMAVPTARTVLLVDQVALARLEQHALAD